MDLPNELISEFAKITKDESPKTEEIVYGTVYDHDGKKYVVLDGSDTQTPVNSTVEIDSGDRVMVMLKNHTATVTGNISQRSASLNYVDSFQITVGEMIDGATSGDNLITKINMTPSDILIQANRINLKGAVTADTIAVGALEVGKNVTMGPDAIISWGQIEDQPTIPEIPEDILTSGDLNGYATTDEMNNAIGGIEDKIPTPSYITEITKNGIKTGEIRLSGNLYRANVYTNDPESPIDEDEFFMIGVNKYGNMQIGSNVTSDYADLNLYANGNIKLFSGGLRTSPFYVDLFGDVYVANELYVGSGKRTVSLSNHDHSNNTIYPINIGSQYDYPSISHCNNVCVHSTSAISNTDVGYINNNASGGVFIRPYTGSSKNFKHDITQVTDELINGFKGLYDVEVKRWKYNLDYIDKNDELYDKYTYGIIAEDLDEVLPEAVRREDGKIVNYNDRRLINAMLYLLQEQNKRLIALENKEV